MSDENRAAQGQVSSLLLTVLAVATAVLVANLYYAQPLIGAIGPAVAIKPELAGAIVSVTQIGYGTGLFLIVPLADLVENRRLVLASMAIAVLALVVEATASSGIAFFAASFAVGLSSSVAQVLVPFVAHLVPPAQRGRVVGNVMAGLLTGIMLARPAALFIAGTFGWRAVFAVSAVLIVGIAAVLARLMPARQPRERGAPSAAEYGRVLVTMVALIVKLPTIRRRAIYQTLMFCVFNLFWTAVPIMLAQRFRLSEHGIGLFALAGAGGALSAPFAGRLADRGYIRSTTAFAMAALTVACLGTIGAAGATALPAAIALILLALLTVLLDAAVQANQVVGQRVVFAVPARIRGRANGIYTTMMFVGGALGSVLGTLSYGWGGWTATALVGAGIGLINLAVFATER